MQVALLLVHLALGQTALADAGYYQYNYAGPLPVDNSSQTSCTTTDVYCTLTSTPLPTCTLCKVQNVQNNGTLPICISTFAGVSCPSAVDAGTKVGQVIPGNGGFASMNNGLPLYCTMANTPQSAPDGGTVVISCQ